MAQVDPNIAMGYRPVQIPLEESPLNRMQKYADFENALVKSQELQQQRQERNELARIMGDSNLEFGSDAFMQQVLKRAPSQYEGIATRALQRENLAAQRATREAEAEKRNRDLARETFQTAVSELINYNTVEEVKTDIDAKEKTGEITPQQATVLRAKLPKDDTQLDSWRVSTMRGLLPPKEQLVDIRAEKKDIREAARLDLEDARMRETQRHQQTMEAISTRGADRAQLQLEETRRHNKAMEGLDARRVSITAAAEQRKAEQGDSPLSQKDKQKREAAYPQSNAAIKGIEAKSESFINDLKALRDHPGLSQITGLIAGRAPAVTKEGRAAQALYDKILAKGGFEMLQQMREASKTGGALGNVSNQEGKQLQASFAAIDRRQDAADVKKALETAISDVEGARTRSREAFSETYSYREQPSAAPAPAAPKPPAVGTVQEGYRFRGGNPADQKNWEKVK
jgi:hypothetical protein